MNVVLRNKLWLETWACINWSFTGLLEVQNWGWNLSHRADASGLTCKPPITAYIFFGSLGHCPISQTIIQLNKIFVQCLYEEENSQVHNRPGYHCSQQCSLVSCLHEAKILVCIRTGMRCKPEEILPFWKRVYKCSLFWTNVYSVCHPVS